ncbi:LytR/AlgR family response regulator transcription factor [Algoriphagus sp. PAP.12]|uniref:LytR/AlgR family response regulator transcription factor n=1 Tax=Algoriphagus sp. PAP.12 TaxID=2996678 RepID=UPI00227B1227|nr:LytTR family DNA-binding domain-containing protein [Algoriphagus sp. PAP.12]
MKQLIKNLGSEEINFPENKLRELLRIFQFETIGFIPFDSPQLIKVSPIGPIYLQPSPKAITSPGSLSGIFYSKRTLEELLSCLNKLKQNHQVLDIIPFPNSAFKIKHVEKGAEPPIFPRKEEQESSNELFIRENGWIKKIYTREILFFQLEGSYTKIQCELRSYMLRITTKDLLQKLKSRIFFQVSKSYLVNLNFLTEMNQSEVRIQDYSIPLGKKYRKELIDHLTIL